MVVPPCLLQHMVFWFVFRHCLCSFSAVCQGEKSHLCDVPVINADWTNNSGINGQQQVVKHSELWFTHINHLPLITTETEWKNFNLLKPKCQVTNISQLVPCS